MATGGQVEDPAPAAAARRRELGAASAPSLLLTVLGEFVAPGGTGTWTGALVAALAAVGVEEKAARQALSRIAAEGLLEAQRQGRRTRWSLTPAGRHLLEKGRQRIYTFMRQEHRWDGRWLVLLVTVPEPQRQLRHKLRTQLIWAGLGSPTPGVWVAPDAGKGAAVAAILAELGLERDSFSWLGPLGEVGAANRLVQAAWSLAEVQEHYGAFLARFGALSARTPAQAFTCQVQLVQAWRRFPFLDPDLPPELLARDWPGPAAARTFATKHAGWHDRAQHWWREQSERAAARP